VQQLPEKLLVIGGLPHSAIRELAEENAVFAQPFLTAVDFVSHGGNLRLAIMVQVIITVDQRQLHPRLIPRSKCTQGEFDAFLLAPKVFPCHRQE